MVAASQGLAASAARLTWKHVHEREPRGTDKRGQVQYRTTTNALIVSNAGSVAATDLTFDLTGIGGTEFIFPDAPETPVTIHPDSSMSWTLIPTSGNTIQIAAEWSEASTPKNATWTVTLQ